MSNSNDQQNKLQTFWKESEPFRKKTAKVFKEIGKWIYRLRSVLLSIPVVIVSWMLASNNMKVLPETVGIFIQQTGNYQWMVDRETAILIPLAVTGGCLFLMFCSRRVVYPWLISIFSLILPILIYITNIFPA